MLTSTCALLSSTQERAAARSSQPPFAAGNRNALMSDATLGARVVRILQDFAGIYRAILLKFFRLSTGWATHNP